MATLKGENFRICIWDTTEEKYRVIGMSTGCNITLTNNTEEASHKDIVGSASMPTTVSKSWSVSVDSLDVSDTATMLTAIKAMEPVLLMWDETSTTDNQTRQKATFARKGLAFFNDLTVTFNNRTNATKQIQLTGAGPIETVGSSEAVDVITVGSVTKGQYVRLFLSSDNTTAPTLVVAAARDLSMHVSVSLESSTTKDTAGDFEVQEPTSLAYDISSSALVRSGETISSLVGAKTFGNLESIYEAGTPVKWKIANVSGDNNRTASSTLVSGSAVLTSLTVNAPNRTPVDYSATLNGYGDFTVGS